MGNLADYIEKHLREMLDRARGDSIEIQRRDLASHFNCVPSQINYVISTRFTIDRGYLVESRRGEGGYIRICRLDRRRVENPLTLIDRAVGDSIGENQVADILFRLRETGMISARDEVLVKMVTRQQCEGLRPGQSDFVRARVFKAALSVLLHAYKAE